MQSLLTDEDTYVVGYDAVRGEPRGRAKKDSNEQFGDCINCRKCVAVCPTGIDIRNGLQIECIGCTACIDACDSIMIKQNKPVGLIRFDSLNGLEHKPKRFWRPRVFLYLVAGLAGMSALTFVALNSRSVAINAMRLPGTPYSVSNGVVQNAYELHIENKRASDVDLVVEADFPMEFDLIAPQRNLHLDKRQGLRVPIFVRVPQSAFQGDETLHLHVMQGDDPIIVDLRFLGPNVTNGVE
jgi:cytochrome c oxidase accessory protein FixG